MKTYVALLRAINVGGTGKLSMADLRQLCQDCGFQDVATYIQSGNVVFRSALKEAGVKKRLEEALAQKMGKPFGALIRTGQELLDVVNKNPFPEVAPNRVIVVFVDEPPPPDSLKTVVAPGGEELVLEGRELYIHFPDGMGQSKLKVPFQKTGTGRNLNTIQKLAAMAQELG
ncbi:MAG TPA: DUF1697 domain-containing protein [Polyangia bacterium]|jgi:uncharacterized protein (DUF1697 family)|nr:DUF1697 domain-containing protein [Polyangia bacterium]